MVREATASDIGEVPELKNMMPNSWKKLTRLPEAEERAFVSQGGGGEPAQVAKHSMNSTLFPLDTTLRP